jgi:hypothetical protein
VNESARRLVYTAIALAVFVGACASLPRGIADGVVNRWAQPSAVVARRLLAEYGTPDDVTPDRISWDRRGPWKRTTVWNREPVYRAPADLAVMQQTVDYRLDMETARRLLSFSDLLEIDLAHHELSSRAGLEEVNFLTINLADQVARGVTTPVAAQAAFSRQLELAAAGKASPEMTGLLFTTK